MRVAAKVFEDSVVKLYGIMNVLHSCSSMSRKADACERNEFV